MALINRVLKCTFVLGEGSFGNSGSKQVELSGLRMSMDASYAGWSGSMEMRVYGMPLSMMNQISTLGFIYTQKSRNSVTVTAGDADNQSVVFQGTINDAWPDMQGAPDVAFHVGATATLINALQPAATTSVNGPADAATLLKSLADQMGLKFEGNGVSVILSHPYHYGSALSQAREIVKHAGLEWNGGANGTLAVWKPGSARSGEITIISKETGMDNYPTYASNGVMFRTLFNPNLQLGSQIQIKTDLKLPYSGNWTINSLSHNLESLVPKGRWFSNVQAVPANSPGSYTPST